MRRLIVLLIALICLPTANASPKEVIIVRHADKLLQPATGPALSPKGVLRSIALALYISNRFGEPDFIIAAHPKKSSDESSIRELQTMGPLISLLSAKHPQTGFPLLHPLTSSDYLTLAKQLLTDKKFDGKQVLVCWSHGNIPALAQALGVTQPIADWPPEDFDTVFVLKYDSQGHLMTFDKLDNQYPVAFNGSWQDLYSPI